MVTRDRTLLWTTLAGSASTALYAALALAGNLPDRLGAYLGVHFLLFGAYAALLFVLFRRAGVESGCGPDRGAEFGSPDPAGAVPTRTTGSSDGPGAGTAPAGGASQEGLGWGPAGLGRVAPGGRKVAAGLLLLGFAALFRLLLVATPPSLSDDIHRYVWDGRVQAEGINPFLHPPDSEELRALRDEGWSKVNHPAIRTIYPPLAQGVFALAAAGGLRERGFKAVLCLFDLAVVLALGWFLSRTGRSPLLAAVYAWNPLVVVEVASSGHSDPIGILLMLLAAGLLAGGRTRSGAAAWAASIGARFLPLAFAPIMVRRLKWHELLIVVAVLAALFAPYAGAGSRLFSGLHAYAENWDHNSVVFPALRAALEAAGPFETLRGWLGILRHFLGDPAWSAGLESLAWPATLARLILLVVFLAGSFVISMDAAGIDQELLLATGLLLVLTPTLHPWYLLWIVPFAAGGPSIPWLLFTALAPLSYLSLRAPGGGVPSGVLAFEWGIPAAAALWLRIGRWRRDRLAARAEWA